MAKQINTRIQHKHDIGANWLRATGFTPLAGEIIVYDPDETHPYPRFKIGDGINNVNNLSFEIDKNDFITLNEIDTICGTIILDTTVNEVTF